MGVNGPFWVRTAPLFEDREEGAVRVEQRGKVGGSGRRVEGDLDLGGGAVDRDGREVSVERMHVLDHVGLLVEVGVVPEVARSGRRTAQSASTKAGNKREHAARRGCLGVVNHVSVGARVWAAGAEEHGHGQAPPKRATTKEKNI